MDKEDLISESMAGQEQLLRSMIRIRMVEEEIARRYSEQQMRCPVHLSIGQEAAAVGVCSALEISDWVFSGHRNHAHYLAKGGNLCSMLAEIYGKESGCCGGKGGSMHLSDQSCGFIGATPIVGSTVPIALGASLTAKFENKNRIVAIFLGDGAMETGVVNESLNFAAVKGLPILFVCENNLYSVYSPLDVRQPVNRTLSDLASGHGLNTLLADGNDADDVFAKATYAIAELRNSSLPYFLELPTYRWREHCGPGFDNDIGYRSEAEFQAWKLKDPIELSKSRMPAYSINDSMARFRDEIQAAFEYAINQPFADISAASANVYAHSGYETDNIRLKTSRHITYREAILEAQDIALESFSNAYIMGLGVPDPKGIFGTTLGLQSKYGHDRVFDIPLSENALTGVAIGSAVTGQRPILIHQRVDFSLVSIDQIVNQAAKWHYMFNGKMAVPLVIRMIIGRGWGQGPQHSQSLHSWFAHVPGLKVVMPVTPYDAKGMLLSAVEDNNPVLILEHRWLHGLKDEVPLESYKVSLDKSRIIARGNDITIVGISYATIECIEAAKILEKNGVKVEVIDLRSIRPLDKDTLLASVSKTRRLLVVDHSEAICGIAGEIIATVAENMSHSLRSKPVRLTLPDHPVPTSHYLAEHYYPTSDNIIQAVASMLQLQDVVLPSLANHIVCKDQPNSFFNGPF